MKSLKVLHVLVVCLVILGGLCSVNAGWEDRNEWQGWAPGCSNWTIPTADSFDASFGSCAGLICDQRISLVGTSDYVCDSGNGVKRNAIPSSWKGHELHIHVHWRGTPNDEDIYVPCYCGGNIGIWSDYYGACSGQTWSTVIINGWANYNMCAWEHRSGETPTRYWVPAPGEQL